MFKENAKSCWLVFNILFGTKPNNIMLVVNGFWLKLELLFVHINNACLIFKLMYADILQFCPEAFEYMVQ